MNMTNLRRSAGFSLIEVLIAVVVLSFGLLALAALQSSLFRAGAEAKARANATAIAQESLEDARTFAYVIPPSGYTSQTYGDLATAVLTPVTLGGVTYKGCRQVQRYVYDSATSRFVLRNSVAFSTSVTAGVVSVTCTSTAIGAVVPVDPSTPEFKQISVAIVWPGDTGEVKSIQLTDSVASVSPSDSIMVLKTPTGGTPGPSIWIAPPTDVGVVPIAIGSDAAGEDIAAASSNPKPEQFVNDVSSVTSFNVQTFTGDQSSGEVLLNRQLEVAAASCVCSDSGAVSTSANPAYAPTVWNGKQLAYQEPDAIVGKQVGSAVISNSDSETTTLCTACCRDHHDAPSTLQSVQVDPYRTHTGTNGDHQHYGYNKTGNSYNISGGLISVSSGEYVEACRLIRVNGRMRLAVDARQNHLAVTPLNSASNGFQNTSFVADYSDFVSHYIDEALHNIPVGYPSPTAALPPPSGATGGSLTLHPTTVETPATIDLSSPTQRKLVDFGLYIDYITQDTLDAYNCAVANDNTGDCEGFGLRNPLEYVPFYAVNVANLGSWASERPGVVGVVNAAFNNQGTLASDGGLVTAGSLGSSTAVPVAEEMNISNSGLTSTAAIDLDDAASTSYANDAQNFLKTAGSSGGGSRNSVFVGVASTSTISLSKISVSAGGTACNFSNRTSLWNCRFDSPGSIVVLFANFTTPAKPSGVVDRKICYPSDVRVVSAVPANAGTLSETLTLTVTPLSPVDYTMKINIIDEASTCPSGSTAASLVP
jgi:prepilin-type N-terminal cleavage/methylation domain-containing protein